jgi:hypothetical protein
VDVSFVIEPLGDIAAHGEVNDIIDFVGGSNMNRQTPLLSIKNISAAIARAVQFRLIGPITNPSVLQIFRLMSCKNRKWGIARKN